MACAVSEVSEQARGGGRRYDAEGRLRLFAAAAVRAGEELSNAYTPLLWATPARRHLLRATKHFDCACQRCADPQEGGACLSGLRCCREGCEGLLLPLRPLQPQAPWGCARCGAKVRAAEAQAVQALLGAPLAAIDASDPRAALAALRRLSAALPPCNHVLLELKASLVWLLGHRAPFAWHELPAQLLRLKEALARELLRVVGLLGAGQCRLRGLLLYELHCTLEERMRRAAVANGRQPLANGSAEEGCNGLDSGGGVDSDLDCSTRKPTHDELVLDRDKQRGNGDLRDEEKVENGISTPPPTVQPLSNEVVSENLSVTGNPTKELTLVNGFEKNASDGLRVASNVANGMTESPSRSQQLSNVIASANESATEKSTNEQPLVNGVQKNGRDDLRVANGIPASPMKNQPLSSRSAAENGEVTEKPLNDQPLANGVADDRNGDENDVTNTANGVAAGATITPAEAVTAGVAQGSPPGAEAAGAWAEAKGAAMAAESAAALAEAADIFRDDVTAPADLQQRVAAAKMARGGGGGV